MHIRWAYSSTFILSLMANLRRNPLENQVIVLTNWQKSNQALHAKLRCGQWFRHGFKTKAFLSTRQRNKWRYRTTKNHQLKQNVQWHFSEWNEPDWHCSLSNSKQLLKFFICSRKILALGMISFAARILPWKPTLILCSVHNATLPDRSFIVFSSVCWFWKQ